VSPDWSSLLTVLVVLGAVLAVMPGFGAYLARVFMNRPAFGDRLLEPIERGLFRLLGVSPREGMRVRSYLTGLLLVNIGVFLWIYLLLTFDGRLFPVAPGYRPMSWDLLVHTASSFTTNTDFTHFTNETSVTLWGMLLAFLVPFFLSAATGLSVAAAFARGFLRRDGTLGNVYVDLVRALTRVLLPLALLAAGVYVLLGVPATLTHFVVAHPPGQAPFDLFLGPVAPWQAIELLGTNGGGFYASNLGSPLANPTAYSALFGLILMLLLPLGVPFAFGHMVRRPSESYPLVGTALAVFVVGLLMFGFFASTGSLLAAGFRFPFPTDATIQFTSVYTNTGATNLDLGQLPPLAQMTLMFGMFTQSTPGGVGTGFATLLVNLVLAVFVGGLMVGRTPEYLGKKIGIAQVRWAALTLLVHPALILVPTAIAYVGGFVTPYTGPGAAPAYCTHAVCLSAHNFTAVLYEFTSEAANNGSAIPEINDGSMFFNLAGAAVMLLGRFLPIVGMLYIASHFADQDVLPPGPGTLRTRSVTFTVYLTLLLVIVTALLFLPVLALGPLSQLGG
jgi:potassium-transporting ATPase potassium-binding subunit